MTEREKILELKNVVYSFHTYGGEVKAVRDVSFEVRKGPKPPNIIEYLLAVSGKMKNYRKAIALDPLWQLHKKSSRNIPGTFFHNRNSCRITSPPVNIFAGEGPGEGALPYLLRWAAISSRYSGRTSKPNSMALSAYSAALS